MAETETLMKKYDLDKFIVVPEIVFDTPREMAESLDKLIDYASWGIEAKAKDLLLHKKAELNYPQIDHDFLRMSKRKKVRVLTSRPRSGETHTYSIGLPTFGVFTLGDNSLTIDIEIDGSEYKLRNVNASFNTKFPSCIEDSLRRAISAHSVEGVYYGDWVPKCSFETYFVGLLPQKVKKEIEDAKRIFGGQIYVITEAKWNHKVPTTDPLVVGVMDDKCFLISEFNTTPLEEYVVGGKDD